MSRGARKAELVSILKNQTLPQPQQRLLRHQQFVIPRFQPMLARPLQPKFLRMPCHSLKIKASEISRHLTAQTTLRL